MAGVNFSEEGLKIFNDESFIKEGMGIDVLLDPSVELFLFKDVVAVGVVSQEDVFYEFSAEVVHCQRYFI